MTRTPWLSFRPAEPVRRKISECIALTPADSTATIDPDFAKDVEADIAAHREPWSRLLGTDARLDGGRWRRAPGKNARQLLESMALKTGDEGIAVSVITVLELAHGIIQCNWLQEKPADSAVAPFAMRTC